MKNNALKRIVFICFVIPVMAFGQKNGTISGTIIDSESGEALIGATAVVLGTTLGSVADLDGNFSITNVAPGTYTVQFSYVSYQTQKIENVVVMGGQVTVLNVRLKSESVGLNEVVVTAESIKDNELALLTAQRKSSLVLDGISSSQFSQNGDSDAASAIRRVTGVSVEGGKYIYVRGLGDRYSKTSLNNTEIPGLDPNRNTVQMDLFPTSLLDNLIVYKTFSPEMPGNCTGGYVNISTKEFPGQFTLQASGSFGYNTNTTFNNHALTHDLGKTHWLGMAPESRQMPAIIKDGVADIALHTDYQRAQQLDAETKSLSNDFSPEQYSPFMNHSFSFSLGDRKTDFGKEVGIIGGLTYQRNYEFYENGKVGRFKLPGTVEENYLFTLYDLQDTRGKESVLWGALLNTTVKLSNNHKIGLNLIHNQGSDASTRYLEGLFPFASGHDPDFFFQGRALECLERSISAVQVKGDHVFGERGIRLDWTSAITGATQTEPDLRYFNNLRLGPGPDYNWDVLSNNIKPASHYFRDMRESSQDFKVNVEVPVRIGTHDSKVKFGGSYVTKERTFDEKIIQYRNSRGAIRYTGDVDAYFDEANLGMIGEPFQYGLYIRDETSGVGSYTGKEKVPAAYAMIDWQVSRSLKISTGVRYEGTDIEIANRGGNEIRVNELIKNDILSALNITKQLNEHTNLRLAYGRTIARPTFRELALFQSFDFQGDFILIGNPELNRTTIDNIDIRWEIFPKSGELISVSTFYKKFTDPIERAVDPNTNDLATQIFFRNVPEAYLMGTELEFRKKLSFISPALDNFFVGANFAYIHSRVDIAEGELKLIRVNDPGADDQRVMFGQSPYIVNMIFSYNHEEKGLHANINYNVQGDRLSVVSTGGTPHVFERSRPVLDFNVRKSMGSRWSLRFSATNLLDSDYAYTHEFKGKTYDYQRYRLGRTFSTGISFLIE